MKVIIHFHFCICAADILLSSANCNCNDAVTEPVLAAKSELSPFNNDVMYTKKHGALRGVKANTRCCNVFTRKYEAYC